MSCDISLPPPPTRLNRCGAHSMWFSLGRTRKKFLFKEPQWVIIKIIEYLASAVSRVDVSGQNVISDSKIVLIYNA